MVIFKFCQFFCFINWNSVKKKYMSFPHMLICLFWNNNGRTDISFVTEHLSKEWAYVWYIQFTYNCYSFWYPGCPILGNPSGWLLMTESLKLGATCFLQCPEFIFYFLFLMWNQSLNWRTVVPFSRKLYLETIVYVIKMIIITELLLLLEFSIGQNSDTCFFWKINTCIV